MSHPASTFGCAQIHNYQQYPPETASSAPLQPDSLAPLPHSDFVEPESYYSTFTSASPHLTYGYSTLNAAAFPHYENLAYQNPDVNQDQGNHVAPFTDHIDQTAYPFSLNNMTQRHSHKSTGDVRQQHLLDHQYGQISPSNLQYSFHGIEGKRQEHQGLQAHQYHDYFSRFHQPNHFGHPYATLPEVQTSLRLCGQSSKYGGQSLYQPSANVRKQDYAGQQSDVDQQYHTSHAFALSIPPAVQKRAMSEIYRIVRHTTQKIPSTLSTRLCQFLFRRNVTGDLLASLLQNGNDEEEKERAVEALLKVPGPKRLLGSPREDMISKLHDKIGKDNMKDAKAQFTVILMNNYLLQECLASTDHEIVEFAMAEMPLKTEDGRTAPNFYRGHHPTDPSLRGARLTDLFGEDDPYAVQEEILRKLRKRWHKTDDAILQQLRRRYVTQPQQILDLRNEATFDAAADLIKATRNTTPKGKRKDKKVAESSGTSRFAAEG